MTRPSTPDESENELTANVLYRITGWFYRSPNQLLYIGKSTTAADRIAQHHRAKDWWVDVTDISLEHFDTVEALGAAEIEAIKNERPRYNIVHNDYRRPPFLLTYLDSINKNDEQCLAETDFITDVMALTMFTTTCAIPTETWLANPFLRCWCDLCGIDQCGTLGTLHRLTGWSDDLGPVFCSPCLSVLVRRAEIKRLAEIKRMWMAESR